MTDQELQEPTILNWRQKTVIHILLIIARWLAEEEWVEEIKQLTTHISVYGKW